MSSVVRCVTAALAFGIALGASGCGVASQAVSAATAAASSVAVQATLPSAQDLWTSTKASMAAAGSAHIQGTVTTGSASVVVDIVGNRDGSNSRMTSTVGGGNGEVLTIGDSQYVRGDAAFWKQAGVSDSIIVTIGTRYVKTVTSADNGAIAVGDALDSMATASFNLVDILNLQVDKADLNGAATYLISERVPTPDQFTMWVSADGASNLLKLHAAATSPVDLNFSEWNEVVPFSAPPASLVITT